MFQCQIYLATSPSGEKYVGQTQTHVLNHGKYRPFGYMRRWNSHVSEAVTDSKENQCPALNTAIRKYGADTFTVVLLHTCKLCFADYFERMYIAECASLSPKGYNLTIGGKTSVTPECKKKISDTLIQHFADPNVREKYSKAHLDPNDQRKIDKYLKMTIRDIEIRKKYFSLHKRDGVRCIIRTDCKTYRIEFCGKHVEYADAFERAQRVCRQLTDNIVITN